MKLSQGGGGALQVREAAQGPFKVSEAQARNERKKIQSDEVLMEGGSNLTLPTNGGM